jgi:hypothetical protein
VARPNILPLSDDLTRAIARGVSAIETKLPGANNRVFLREFIPLVAGITGQVFGAQTYQKLLRPLAPDRSPSSTTVQAEIAAYRARQKGLAVKKRPNLAEAELGGAVDVYEDSTRPAGPRQGANAMHAPGDLATSKQKEIDHWRQRVADLEAQAEEALRAQAAAVADADLARAELAALQKEFRELKDAIDQLSKTARHTPRARRKTT